MRHPTIAHRTRRWMVVLIIVGAIAGVCGGATMASFSATTGNSGNSFSAAASFPCSQLTITADADSYVDNGAKTTNYGTAINIRTAGGVDVHRSLFHFTLPSITGCTLTSASLHLWGNSGNTDGINRTIDVLRVATTWSESTVTWNNQPATTGTATTLLATNGVHAFDVTTQVAAMYQGTPGDSSFLAKYTTESGGGGNRWFTVWNTREASTNKPVLVLTLA